MSPGSSGFARGAWEPRSGVGRGAEGDFGAGNHPAHARHGAGGASISPCAEQCLRRLGRSLPSRGVCVGGAVTGLRQESPCCRHGRHRWWVPRSLGGAGGLWTVCAPVPPVCPHGARKRGAWPRPCPLDAGSPAGGGGRRGRGYLRERALRNHARPPGSWWQGPNVGAPGSHTETDAPVLWLGGRGGDGIRSRGWRLRGDQRPLGRG